jgi:hypothetical protein
VNAFYYGQSRTGQALVFKDDYTPQALPRQRIARAAFQIAFWTDVLMWVLFRK